MAEVKLEPCPPDVMEAGAAAIYYADTRAPWSATTLATKFEYRKLAAAAYAAWNRRSDGWRPIEEASKDADEPILATGKDYGSGERHYAAVTWNGNAWEDDEGNEYIYLTHFMHITPPEKSND